MRWTVSILDQGFRRLNRHRLRHLFVGFLFLLCQVFLFQPQDPLRYVAAKKKTDCGAESKREAQNVTIAAQNVDIAGSGQGQGSRRAECFLLTQ